MRDDKENEFEEFEAPRKTRKSANFRTFAIYGFALTLLIVLLYFAY